VSVSALWVGDSFTRGEGAGVPPGLTYPFLVGAGLGWTCRVDAQNGTGFLNDGFLAGPGLAPLIDRLPGTARAGGADVVVVDAGRNDGIAAERGLRAAVEQYLAALRLAFPAAHVVVVLPTLLDWWQPSEYHVVAAVLRDVAAAHGADVVDPAAVEGFAEAADGPDLVCLDGFHPSAAGQEHYAEVLTHLLRGVAREIAP
jgi:lysophospholipase L1-like esterase